MLKPGKINILYVYSNLDRGGAQVLLSTIIKYIDKKQFNPFVYCFKNAGSLTKDIEGLQTKIFFGNEYSYRNKKRSKLSLLVESFFTIIKLLTVIRNKNIHIVHTSLQHANTYGRIAAWFCKVPVIIMTEHGAARPKRLKHIIEDRILARITDKIVCVSESGRDYYSRVEKIPIHKFEVIHNCIDISKFEVNKSKNELRSEYGFCHDKFIVGTVANFFEWKGHKHLLDAWSNLYKKLPQAKLLLIGWGPLKNSCKRMAADLGISQSVSFLGERSDIPELLRTMDVFVLPSLHEGFGIVLLEAMCSSLPIVASNVGGIPEAIQDGVTGLLVPPGDSYALCHSILKVLSDDTLRLQMGDMGKGRVMSYFSAQSYLTNLQDLYKRYIPMAKI